MMLLRSTLVLTALLACIACASNGSHEESPEVISLGKTLTLRGKLAVVGITSRTSYLAIDDIKSDKRYQIQNPDTFHLMERQNETVALKAKLLKAANPPAWPALIKVLEVKN